MAELIDEAKERCNITWTNTATDSRIKNLVDEATAEMNNLLGSSNTNTIDYSKDLVARDLLLNLILYKWNEQADKFRDAYQQQIIECRRTYDVAFYSASLTSSDTSSGASS